MRGRKPRRETQLTEACKPPRRDSHTSVVVGNKEQSIDAASAAAVAPHLRQYSASELTDHAEVLRWINDAVGSYSSPPTAFTIAVPNTM